MTLEVRDIGVSFGGVIALDGVSARFDTGTINAVIGPNGSGKSTLFNCITGFVKLSAGTVHLDDTRIDSLLPAHRISAGVARTFQTPRFDPNVTVEEAVLCGFYTRSRASIAAQMLRPPAVVRSESDSRAACIQILHDLELVSLRTMRIGQLPMGQVRLVEVARAIANQPKYILLDEPAAGLTRDEQRLLARVMLQLAGMGIGVVLVEHNFGLVCDVAKHVLVLNRGKTLASGTPASVRRHQGFIEAYLGSAAKDTGAVHGD